MPSLVHGADPGLDALALPSGGIAAVPPTRLACRSGALLLAAAALVGACSDGSGDPERADPSPTTTAGAMCPDGEAVPDAAPVADVPEPAAQDRGPDGREGALDIGTLLPRSGDLVFLGTPALAGVELAVADLEAAGGVLGAPIGLRHGDSAEGTPDVAEAEVARLLDAGADVIVGPIASGTASRVLDQVASASALLVSPGGTSSGLDALDRAGRFFRMGPTESLQGAALAELIRDDGHRTVTVAARADDYGRAVSDALAVRLEQRGGSVLARVEYDPTAAAFDQEVVGRLDLAADAIVLVGLAETALVVDALVEEGEGPTDRPTYGTDGNLGERLGDLVADRSVLACMRGLLPVAVTDDAFAERVRAHDPALSELDDAGLDLAAESYDAVVLAALAAEASGTDEAGAVAGAMPTVTRAGVPCDDVETCLALAGDGTDLAYRGRTGRIALDDRGNRDEAPFTVVAFDADGHLARLGSRRVRR